MSKWLTWSPDRQQMEKSPEGELPKLPKPASVGFGSDLPRDFSITRGGHPIPSNELADERCYHCAGSGRCNCICCGHYEAHMTWTTGPCVPCEARKRRKDRVQ
jgi:hypothetical protein